MIYQGLFFWGPLSVQKSHMDIPPDVLSSMGTNGMDSHISHISRMGWSWPFFLFTSRQSCSQLLFLQQPVWYIGKIGCHQDEDAVMNRTS